MRGCEDAGDAFRMRSWNLLKKVPHLQNFYEMVLFGLYDRSTFGVP